MPIRSPPQSFIFIIQKDLFRIKMSQKTFYSILEKEALLTKSTVAMQQHCPQQHACTAVKTDIKNTSRTPQSIQIQPS